MRVADLAHYPVPGSTHGECERCHAAVWLSPGSRVKLESGQCSGLICNRCITTNPDDMVVGWANPEEVARLKKFLEN